MTDRTFKSAWEADETMKKLTDAFGRYMNYGSIVSIGEARVFAREFIKKLDAVATEEERRCRTN